MPINLSPSNLSRGTIAELVARLHCELDTMQEDIDHEAHPMTMRLRLRYVRKKVDALVEYLLK